MRIEGSAMMPSSWPTLVMTSMTRRSCSVEWAAQTEQRSKAVPLGVAGGNARFTYTPLCSRPCHARAASAGSLMWIATTGPFWRPILQPVIDRIDVAPQAYHQLRMRAQLGERGPYRCDQ